MSGRQLMARDPYPADLERYSRQMRLPGVDVAGQRRIRAARVLVCGCGALGCAVADGLTRAGVGFLRIVDRDFVELSNLQRQVLFAEPDVEGGLPKAIAATNRLRQINSQVQFEPVVADVNPGNMLELARDVDLIIDGLDNFETRFLINDAALELGKPWIYAGCLGSHGQVMPILPGQTACLRCLLGEVESGGAIETCDTAGVWGPAIAIVTALEVNLALRLLLGNPNDLPRQLLVVDAWEMTVRSLNTARLREESACPTCVGGRRDWLSGDKTDRSTVLCGRNAVQISPAEPRPLELPSLAARWSTLGEVSRNAFLLRFEPRGTEMRLTVFPDGRVIVQGTADPMVARQLYSRYVGN